MRRMYKGNNVNRNGKRKVPLTETSKHRIGIRKKKNKKTDTCSYFFLSPSNFSLLFIFLSPPLSRCEKAVLWATQVRNKKIKLDLGPVLISYHREKFLSLIRSSSASILEQSESEKNLDFNKGAA